MFKTLNLIFILIFCVHNGWSQSVGNAVNLETLWQFQSESFSERKLLPTSEGIIVSLTENKFILLDADKGEILWTIEVAGEVISEPFADEDFLFFPTSRLNDNSIIKKFSLKTGIQIGTETKVQNTAQNLNASDNVIKITSQNNTIKKNTLDKVIWKTKLGGSINDILINKYGILVSSSDNYLYQLNKKNGNKIWKIRFKNKVLGSNLLNENVGVVNIYAENKVQIIDVQKGKLNGFFLLEENEFPVNKPLFIKDKVLLQTNVRIICLKLKK